MTCTQCRFFCHHGLSLPGIYDPHPAAGIALVALLALNEQARDELVAHQQMISERIKQATDAPA